ncbi:extracellular solute-binding protein [Camelimonas abortus]
MTGAAAAALAAALPPRPAGAQGAPAAAPAGEPPWLHALSLMGTPKYGPDARHFDYVNPAAPKGGLARLAAPGGFDNFNPVVDGVKGALVSMIDLIYDELMTQSLDEVSTAYGLIAGQARRAADFSWVSFRLRPQARWHDGRPITVDDVIFSFESLKKLNPVYGFYWRDVKAAEQTGEREVTFRFAAAGNRELPQIMGQLRVMPRHWWEGTDASGRRRDIGATTLEPPLGSGPYRIKAFDAGRWCEFERVDDYWAADLPVNVGAHNFATLRVDYYRDLTVMFEAFKGDQVDFRVENVARNWATGYDFPAVREGRVVREEFPQRSSGVMQAFVYNLRRPLFQDARVRRALNYAFNFEEVNRTLFYGQYARIDSYFWGTELASSGLPEGLEKEILESVRDLVPPAAFTEPYRNPVAGSQEAFRDNLREAHRLLAEAGWVQKGRQLTHRDTGQPFVFEYVTQDAAYERPALMFRNALQRLGITMNLRTVDSSQYQNRLRNFDFDATTFLWPESLSPGNEQWNFWGSEAAKRPGSRNIAGIADAGVDALIRRVVYAATREELVAATRALDRVLLHHHYMTPQWGYRFQRTARWNRFAHPQTMPEYGASAFPTIWWWDEALAAKTGGRR